jgi:hypothetical protein
MKKGNMVLFYDDWSMKIGCFGHVIIEIPQCIHGNSRMTPKRKNDSYYSLQVPTL